MGNDSWTTVDPEDELMAGTSLRKRAEQRTVEQIGSRAWRVLGEEKFGDAYPEYLVTLEEGARKYECTCYLHGRGETRRRKMCSHVLATIIFRKANPEWIFEASDIENPDFENKMPWQDDEPFPTEISKPVLKVIAGEGEDDADGAPGPFEAGQRFLSVSAGTLSDIALSPQHEALGEPPIPDKFATFRPHQWKAILEILEHLENGVKVVMLSAPTGSGKTLIGEAIQRFMPGKNVYACTTKTLQDQIQWDFPYSRTIKGRANYRTQNRADLTCDDCTWTSSSQHCHWCDHKRLCPYVIEKKAAAASRFPILNVAYYLAETKVATSLFFGRDLVIIDEADTMEEQLMSNIEVQITAKLRKWLGVRTIPKKTVANDWVRWLHDDFLPALSYKRAEIKSQIQTLYGEPDTKKMRQVRRLDRLEEKILPLLRTAEDESVPLEDGWVMTGYEGSKDENATITFKPIRVDEHARAALWSMGKQFLLMTATLISPAQMAADLGLEDDEWEVVHIDSTFPAESRPVIVDTVASVTNKTKEESWPKLVEKIDEIMLENPGVRILVHTVSYHLTRYIYEHSNSGRLMTYWDARDRERVLKKFLETDDAVLLAPSFERGIDLPEEDCQVIVIAKVPYPYLGDKQVAARMYTQGGKTWYAVQTIRSIVQMTGRGMRSKDDWCDTYIIDSQFKRLWRQNLRLFPGWWKEAVAMSSTDPKYKHLIDAARERRESRRRTART